MAEVAQYVVTATQAILKTILFAITKRQYAEVVFIVCTVSHLLLIVLLQITVIMACEMLPAIFT